MIIIAGAVVLLLIIFAVAYTMMSSGGEPAPAPSPADALESDLPPSEERSADQESELMQKKQEASEDANAPTPDVQKKEVKKGQLKRRHRRRSRKISMVWSATTPRIHGTRKRTSGRT